MSLFGEAEHSLKESNSPKYFTSSWKDQLLFIFMSICKNLSAYEDKACSSVTNNFKMFDRILPMKQITSIRALFKRFLK